MTASNQDPVLDTLLLPIASGEVAWPTAGRVLFLRARVGAAVQGLARATLVCEQSFKPEADALARAGFSAAAHAGETFPLVLVLPPRSRDETRLLFAQALARVSEGGVVLACVANNQGARSAEDDLSRIAGAVSTMSKHKCRVFWLRRDTAHLDAALLAEWLALDAPRAMPGSDLLSRAGVFSADAIDPASRLLAEHLPQDLAGRAADLGAGCGYLALALAARNPGIAALDLFEAEARALEVARLNLQQLPRPLAVAFHWHDVSAGLPGRYDVIVSNPPFHQGRADAPDLGRSFIIAAAKALARGGRLWLVANRHLPYEQVLAEHFAQQRMVVVRDGFKVIEARLSP